MRKQSYSLLLAAAVALSAITPAMAIDPPANLYLPNDRGTGWFFNDSQSMNVPRFSKDKVGSTTTMSMHVYSEKEGSENFFFISNALRNDWNSYTADNQNILWAPDGTNSTEGGNITLSPLPYSNNVYNYSTLKRCYKLPAGEYAVDMVFNQNASAAQIKVFNCYSAPEKLYFNCDLSDGNGWNFGNAPEFTKVSDNKFTFELNATASTYFFISRLQHSSWDAMTQANATSAYGIVGDEYQGGNRVVDGNDFDVALYGTIQRCYMLPKAGKYTITMEFRPTGDTNKPYQPHLHIDAKDDNGEIIPLPEPGATAMPAKYTGVMLQGFYWDSYNDTKWTNLTENGIDLSNYFDLIWVPNSGKPSGNPSMGYDPVYWYTTHNSAFGTEDELLGMTRLFNDINTNAIEDVVVNHRGGATNWTDFPTEVDCDGNTWTWGPWAICSTDEVKNQADQEKPTGNPDTGDDFAAFRDLDHTNTYVQDGIKAYLKTLHQTYGYNGWRFDMVKGFSANYVGDYVRDAGMKYCVGEYWDNYDNIVPWINGTGRASAAFDFPAKFAINEAMNGNEDLTKLVWKRNGTTPQPAGLIHHNEYNRYAVTFVDNHDTYRDNNKFAKENLVVAANAFILCSPGTPCVFLRHYLDHPEAIQRLIDIRKAVGVNNESEVTVLKSAANIYMAKVKGLYGELVVKIGSEWGTDCTEDGFKLVASGNETDNNYAVWAKLNDDVYPHVALTPSHAPGNYQAPFILSFTGTNIPENAVLIYTTDGTYPTPVNGTQTSMAANRGQAAAAPRRVALQSNDSNENGPWIELKEQKIRAAVYAPVADPSDATKTLMRPVSPLFTGDYTLPQTMTGIADLEADTQTISYNASAARLEGFDEASAHVEVFSTLGTLMCTSANLSALQPGVYIYRVTLADGTTDTGRIRK